MSDSFLSFYPLRLHIEYIVFFFIKDRTTRLGSTILRVYCIIYTVYDARVCFGTEYKIIWKFFCFLPNATLHCFWIPLFGERSHWKLFCGWRNFSCFLPPVLESWCWVVHCVILWLHWNEGLLRFYSFFQGGFKSKF